MTNKQRILFSTLVLCSSIVGRDVYADCYYGEDCSYYTNHSDPRVQCKMTGFLNAVEHNATYIDPYTDIGYVTALGEQAYRTGTYYSPTLSRFAACTYNFSDLMSFSPMGVRYTWCDINGTWQRFWRSDPNLCNK